jgi:hypothetical protein
MVKRPRHVLLVYEEEMALAAEAEERARAKYEGTKVRYEDLLREYYYKPHHTEVPWEEAQKDMQHRSAYRGLTEADRQVMWEDHMNALREKHGQPLVDYGRTAVPEDPAPSQGDGNGDGVPSAAAAASTAGTEAPRGNEEAGDVLGKRKTREFDAKAEGEEEEEAASAPSSKRGKVAAPEEETMQDSEPEKPQAEAPAEPIAKEEQAADAADAAVEEAEEAEEADPAALEQKRKEYTRKNTVKSLKALLLERGVVSSESELKGKRKADLVELLVQAEMS